MATVMTVRVFLTTTAAAILCSGCVGFSVHGNERNRAEGPILSIDRAKYFGSHGTELAVRPTKNQVLNAWGKPNRIETSGQGNARWIYEDGIRWNGLVIFLGVPLPLLIPVGADYMAVEYEDDSVIAVETLNNEVVAGALCGFYAVHDIEFGCEMFEPSGYRGVQFLGGSRDLPTSNIPVDADAARRSP